MPDHEILELAKTIRYDLTALQAKLTELLRMAGNLQAPDASEHMCPTCQLHFQRLDKLAEHLYITHDGPEPPHWLRAEALADDAGGVAA